MVKEGDVRFFLFRWLLSANADFIVVLDTQLSHS